ncbi:MAG: glycosyltransferase family A protein [Candidatus Uhrbacteria bacterium]
MSNRLISIIIPTYNDALFLRRCLDSVFSQSFQNFEVIVVNDGSTDNTLEVLESYRDRITLIDQTNQGRNPARMRGYAEIKGQFLLFLDSDIEMRSDMLERLFQALTEHPEKAYAYSSFRFGGKLFKGFPFDPDRLRQVNYIHTSALIRREDFPGFDPAIKKFQDWDVWLTMLEQGKTGVFVDQVLFKASVDQQALSKWMPKIAYRIPWKLIGWKPKAITEYEQAKTIIQQKHGIKPQ